jgi:hypothetical protein
MNLCLAAELEIALKDLLVYNLAGKKTIETSEAAAFSLASEDYLKVLKVTKESLFPDLPEIANPDDFKSAAKNVVENSSLEKYVNNLIFFTRKKPLFCKVLYVAFY